MAIAEATASRKTDKGIARHLAFALDRETEQVVRETFDAMRLSFTDIRRGGIKDACKLIGEKGSPRLLIVDINADEMPVSTVSALADVCEPGVRVLVIGECNDIGVFRDLSRLGVSDYLVKPINRDLLQRGIHDALENNRSAPRRAGKVIAVAGLRGGVGASTLVAGLGAQLAGENKRRTAIVDLDVNAGSQALLADRPLTAGLRDVLEGTQEPDATFLDRTLVEIGDRLYLAGCEEALDDPVALTPEGLQALIGALTQRFHYVLLDLPRRVDPAFTAAVAQADVRLLVADPSLQSCRDALRTMKLLQPDSEGTQETLIALNHRNPQQKNDVSRAQLEERIGLPVTLEIPHVRDLAACDNNGGGPLQLQGAARESTRTLARRIAGQRAQAPRKSVFNWLKRS